ncbi:CE1 family esterase [Roseivivax sp. CAU 1753]
MFAIRLTGVMIVALLAAVACANTAPTTASSDADLATGEAPSTLRERIAERRAARNGDQPVGASVDGLQQFSFSFQGRERSYFVDPATTGSGRPAVLVFHGGEGDGRKAQQVSDLTSYARQQGFTAVFPNSPGQQWNDGRATTASGIDDVGYTRALVSDLRTRFGTDTSRVFASGISNGGMFVQRLACDAPDLFRAYAVVAANMPADLSGRCRTGQPQPMIFFNGTDDRLMPFGGGAIPTSRLMGLGVGGNVLSNVQTRDFWAGANSCGAPTSTPQEDRVNDDTRLQLIRYECASGASLRFYLIEGGGHTWPDSSVGGSRLAGTVSREISATSAMLSFFRGYGL